MKKYILYLLTGMAACGLCSCEDALDRYPKDRLSPDEFFHTEEECQLYTNDFYTIFPAAGTIYGETADMEAAGAKAIAQTPEHLVELLREM